MTKLAEIIQNDFKAALKGKRLLEVGVLRMLMAAVKNKEIEKKEKEKGLSDEEIILILQSEIKKRKEAIELYKKGERGELAEKEEKERKFLEKYLPEQLSEQDLRAKVKAAIEKLDAAGLQDLGKVMGVLMPKVRGKAEGASVSEIVQDELKKISQ